MADKKISQLTGASTPVAGTEVLPIVQSGATVKVSIDNLTAGKSVSAASFVPTSATVPVNGIFLGAANSVSIATNTTEHWMVNASGNLNPVGTKGIGTNAAPVSETVAMTFSTSAAAAGSNLSGNTLAADGTDTNININITPKGTGEVAMAKVNIDGGAIDGTTIGANSAAAGTFSSLTSTADATINSITVGRGAASVTTNTAVGTSALGANQADGTNNTAVGYQALDANTTGDENTAVGQDALGALSTGTGNTGLGYGAGSALTTGSKNVVVGKYSGNSGGVDIRTSSNNVMLSDGDGNLVQWFASGNDTRIAPQVNTGLRRYVKTVSLNANATTDLITFTQSTYQMNVIGTFEILFIDTAYPNGCISQLSNGAFTTTTGDSVVRGTYSEISKVSGAVGTISLTIASATSKTGGVLNGIFKITGQTNADTSGTCVIIFNGIIDGCTIS